MGMLDTDHDLENRLRATVYTVAVLTCHCTNAFAAIVTLADPTSGTTPAGKWLMAALGCWALYRLATRSLRNVFIAIDYAFVLAICAANPHLITGSELVQQWGTQQAVAASAIVTLAVVLPVRISLPMTALILATYAWASASVFGWESVAAMASLRYFAIAVAMSVLIRVALLRVAAATKRAHETYWRAGGIRKRVAAAATRYEREQFALLHDTAASTLLLVGNGTPVPQEKLVAQARSALAVLNGQPSTHPLQPHRIGSGIARIGQRHMYSCPFPRISPTVAGRRARHGGRSRRTGGDQQRGPARQRNRNLRRHFE